MTQAVASEQFATRITYTRNFSTGRTNLTCTGRPGKEGESASLASLLDFIFPAQVSMEPEDSDNFGLEAKVSDGYSQPLDMNEGQNTHYWVEVRPSRGKISGLHFHEARVVGSNGASSTFVYGGGNYFKGHHVVTIFLNPIEAV